MAVAWRYGGFCVLLAAVLYHAGALQPGAAGEQPGDSAPKFGRELALCLVGQLRGICQADDFFSLFNVVLADFASVDAFLVFPQVSCLEDVALFEAAAAKWHGDLQIYPRCQADDMDEPAEVELIEWFTGNEWWMQHYFAPARWRNHVLQYKHVHLCGQEIAKQSEFTSYRFAARARPDAEWGSFPSRLELDAAIPGHILVNSGPMPAQLALEDQFVIGAPEDMMAYFKMYVDAFLNIERWDSTAVPWCVVHALLRTNFHCTKVAPENLLEEQLRLHKDLQVQKRQAICFDRVAPCMKPRFPYCREYKRNVRGYLESKLEDFELYDRDFYLTVFASYADYDTVLAARFVHFFLAEAVRLGHPPRVLDLGCGRGSYVEVFRSWGIPVVGVDGNAVILRTIETNAVLWDLTEPLDLREAFGPLKPYSEACDFAMGDGEGAVGALGNDLAAALGLELQLGVLSLVPRILQSYYRPSRHPEGHELVLLEEGTAVEYMKSLCCADQRCFGFAFTLDGGTLLGWLEAGLTAAGGPMDPSAHRIWYKVGEVPFVGRRNDGVSEMDGPRSYSDAQLLSARYGLMDVQFSAGDWVLALGLGAEVPRMRERVMVANIAQNAEQGVIISWGKGRNLRSKDEVVELFGSYGFVLDQPLTDSLRLFSGFVHAEERSDLLVLRRAQATSFHPDSPLEMIDQWGGRPCQEAGAELWHGLQGEAKSQFGPLGRGRMWASGHCAGLFRAGPRGPPTICGGHTKMWRECVLADEVPGAEGATIPMDRIEASALYDAADQMVPREGTWYGDARLNVVFFRLARALAAPRRVPTLQFSWTWLWTSSWEVLLAQPPEPHRVFHPRTRSVQPGTLLWQLGRIALVLHQLSCRLRHLSEARAQLGPWTRSFEALQGLEELKANGLDVLAGALTLQLEISAALRGVPVEKALRDAVFADEILPRMWRLLGGPPPNGSGGLGLIPREAGCADPVFRERVNVAAFWDKESDTGWYLYRLAALDPSM